MPLQLPGATNFSERELRHVMLKLPPNHVLSEAWNAYLMVVRSQTSLVATALVTLLRSGEANR